MMIVTKYDIGDAVRIGPHEGRVMRIVVGQTVTYVIGFWAEDGSPVEYQAYDWELKLIERAADVAQGEGS